MFPLTGGLPEEASWLLAKDIVWEISASVGAGLDLLWGSVQSFASVCDIEGKWDLRGVVIIVLIKISGSLLFHKTTYLINVYWTGTTMTQEQKTACTQNHPLSMPREGPLPDSDREVAKSPTEQKPLEKDVKSPSPWRASLFYTRNHPDNKRLTATEDVPCLQILQA